MAIFKSYVCLPEGISLGKKRMNVAREPHNYGELSPLSRPWNCTPSIVPRSNKYPLLALNITQKSIETVLFKIKSQSIFWINVQNQ